MDLPEGGAADSSAGGGAELAAALAGAAEALRKRFPEMFKESQATDTPRTQGTSQNSRRLFWLSRMLKESQATDKPRTPGTSRRCHKGLARIAADAFSALNREKSQVANLFFLFCRGSGVC